MSPVLFITIDTEEDEWGEYRVTHNLVDNVARLPILQDLFDRYGAVPTYLINWPVVMNEHARHVLQDFLDRGRCEIGTHCHPWNTPPFEEKLNKHNSMICNLTDDIIMRKIGTLHEAIVKHFEVTPLCFRAGRFGFGPGVARSIKKLGYRIDTSVTPFIDWTDYKGVDFSDAPAFAYWFDPDDILREKANGCLLEVPITIGFFQKNFKQCSSVRKRILRGPLYRRHILGILDKLRILNFRWLTSELSSGSEMIRLSKNFIRLGYRFLNMSFHSTSMLPGKGPFVRNQEQLKAVLHHTEIFLQFAVDQGMTFLPLSGALQGLK